LKQLTAILLSAVMMLYSIGFYFIYEGGIRSAKESIHSAIEAGKYSEDIITIRIAKTDLQIIGENEISWQGKMYDVVSSKVEGEEIIFACLADKNETTMISTANDHIQKQADQSAGKKSISVNKNITLYFEEHSFIKTIQLFKQDEWSVSSINLHTAPYHNIPSPPPWSC